MKNYNKNWWYSLFIVLLIIWFLFFISVWVFNLILNDMKDNRALWDYYKAYAWAESAWELALLQIKKHWYWFYDKINHDINNRSIILANEKLDLSKFKKSNDIFFSYDIWSKVNDYNWELYPLKYDIIPLFYIEEESWSIIQYNISWLNISILEWDESKFSWNIIWENNWLTWIWNNTNWTKKQLNFWKFSFENQEINDFLTWTETNYLVVFNSWNSWLIKYNINSLEYFSKPRTTISTSAQVSKYKQNLDIDLDNTEFINILKYSIFSQ